MEQKGAATRNTLVIIAQSEGSRFIHSCPFVFFHPSTNYTCDQYFYVFSSWYFSVQMESFAFKKSQKHQLGPWRKSQPLGGFCVAHLAVASIPPKKQPWCAVQTPLRMETRSAECRARDLRQAAKTGSLNKVTGETPRVNRPKTECALCGGSTCFASFSPGARFWTTGTRTHLTPTKNQQLRAF